MIEDITVFLECPLGEERSLPPVINLFSVSQLDKFSFERSVEAAGIPAPGEF